MECKYCGRWSPVDRETGYDADDVCPTCAESEDDWNDEDDITHVDLPQEDLPQA